LALFLAIPALMASPCSAPAQDAFDFGDPLPLPPPPLEDSTPSPATAPLTPPAPAVIAPPAPALPIRPPATIAGSGPAAPPLALPPAPLDDGVSAVALPPAPGSEAVSTAPAAAAAADERPRPGKITGGRVNVRAGPNTQYESIAVLGTGAPLTVLARHGEWFKIVFPADQLASVHRNYVDVAIEGDIPEEGVQGVINQNDADVHAFYWDKSTVVGKLRKGDGVTVRQERGQWFRIDAPPSARAYVFGEYVRVEGDGNIPVDSVPPPENPSVDLAAGKQDATGRLKLSENDRRAAELKEAYFKRLRDVERREEEREREQVNALTQALDDLEAKLNAVDQETSGMLSYPVQTTVVGGAQWAPPDPMYGGFTGWVENIGRVGGAPASFRLSKGGEVRFYLRSDRFNLADYAGRRVWVNGNIELAAGAVANILNVAELRPLTEVEIAEGMTQTPQAAQPAGVYDAPPMVQPQQTAIAATATYGTPGAMMSDPYSAPSTPASDPYAALYANQPGATGYYSSTVTAAADNYGVQTSAADYFGTQAGVAVPQAYAPPIYAPAPALPGPGGPSALPDHVGSSYPAGSYPAPMSQPANLGGSYGPYLGEVESDYYEQPFISEVGP
jgi:SH3-like domain-containing protein